MSSVELIPRSVIFGNPEKTSPQISPDGRQLAYVAPHDGVLNVWIANTHGSGARAVTNDRDRGVRSYAWAADNAHLLYVQDAGGDENNHLFSANIESGEVRDLTPYENIAVMFIAHDKHHPNDILVGINKENPALHDLYHVDLPTAAVEMRAKNPGNIIQWIPDRDLTIRAGLAVRSDGGYDLLLRDTEDSEWRTLLSWNSEDVLTSSPLGFTRDGNGFYLIDSREANTSRLVKLNLLTGALEVVAGDPVYDVVGVEFHPDTYEIQYVNFAKDRHEMHVLDESIREDITYLRAIGDGDMDIVSRDNSDEQWIVDYVVDNGPAAWYLYNRRDRKATHIFDSRPELRNYTLGRMEPVSFTSRDGLEIHAYISFPVGAERKNLPMVLNVHGGPWARDTWGYNAEAQWLANRGYVCLQVNYRGSTGYGKHFLNAGNREWGGRMHDDLVDAVEWAVAKGYADPLRVAIYGGSYGGYAALVGATFTPDLFRCAVAIVGPSNLMTFINTIPPYWAPIIQQFYQRVGNPETEAEFLKSRSPLFKIDQIKIPMIIAHGANDPRVKQSESEQIVEAMKEKGIEHQYLLYTDEGHGFAKPENRMSFYAATEKFLAEHLGGRYEEAGKEVVADATVS